MYGKDAQTDNQTGFDHDNFVKMGQNKDLEIDLASIDLKKFVD